MWVHDSAMQNELDINVLFAALGVWQGVILSPGLQSLALAGADLDFL